MIKLVRDFYVPGDDDIVFGILQKYLPEHLDSHPEDEYKVLEEIVDEHTHTMYRKSQLKRNSFLSELPNMVLKTLPKEFLESVGHLTEETIFDKKNKKLSFSIVSGDIYRIKGTTVFIPITKDKCKVITILYFHLLEAEKHFPNKTVYSVLMPFLKNKIPERFITNQNIYYNEILKKYNPTLKNGKSKP
jgi:hypothetical protein